ncbi:hypothetical protein ACFWQC_04810 [Nocardioides sp. NPDC058538]|uniref:hypothetical protein n=1 Tax=Nocardioides sp. NPDC058538 TaxID=3346542 RepID=UPI0036477684
MEISSPLPPPDAVSAAVLALAASKQPRTFGEGLDLLRSAGIGNGAVARTENDASRFAVETTEAWHTTNSGLMLDSSGAVEHFWSHLWVADVADGLRPGFAALIESITVVLGAADDDDLKADGSHTAYWQGHTAEVELYLHAERPPAVAAAQIGITWADGTVRAARVT